MTDIGESSVDQVQPQAIQDTKQTNGTDFVNGMNSPEDLKMMEPYKTPADDEVIPKQNTNGDFGMDQDNPFGVQGQNQDLLSDTKDQQVPQNLDTFDTLPADIGTSVDESSQYTTGADGVLIDFEGKESPKPNTVPGMQRLNPFVQSNDTETNSSNPFLSDYSEPPDQGGLSESMECHEDQDISPSDESSLTSSSLSQRQDMPVGGEQQFQSDIAPMDATEMEFESSPSNFDQSLSSAVGGPMPETYKTDEFQTEEIQSGDSAIELGDQAEDVIQDDVAQSAEDVPVAPAEMEEVPSQYERKISHDEQIVPGVCSCTEPEPESSGSENNDNEQMEGVQKVEDRPTPEIRLQREDNDYVDSGEIDGENEGDVNEYYDDQSDEDELTPSENLTRSGEGELVVMSDPGVVRRGDDEEYSDEGEGVEIYTDDESYSDEEYVEGEGRAGDRASEDREFSSEYSEEGAFRVSSEREISPLVGDGSSKEASPPVNNVKDEGPMLEGKDTNIQEDIVPLENESVPNADGITEKTDEGEGAMPQYPKDIEEVATEDVAHHIDVEQLNQKDEEPESMDSQVGQEFDSAVQQDVDDGQMQQESTDRGEYEESVPNEEEQDMNAEFQSNIMGFEQEQKLQTDNVGHDNLDTDLQKDTVDEKSDQVLMEQLSHAPDLTESQLKTPESISKQEEFEPSIEPTEQQLQETLDDQIEPEADKGPTDSMGFDHDSEDDEQDEQELPDGQGQVNYNEAYQKPDLLESLNEKPFVDQKDEGEVEPQRSEMDEVEPQRDQDLMMDQNVAEQMHFENVEQQFMTQPSSQSELPSDNIIELEKEDQGVADGPLEDFETEKVTEVSEGFDQFESSQEIEGKISSDTHENVESSDHFIEGIHETVESSDHFVEGIHETVEASDHVKENTHGNVESGDNLMEDTHENVEVDDHAMEAVDLVPEVDESTAVEEGQTTLPETDVESDKKNILDFEQGRGAIDVAHPFPVTPQGVPPPITPEYQEGEEMLPAVVGKQVDGVVDQSIGAEPVENGMGGECHEAGVNGDIQDDRVEVEGQDIGKSEREMTDNDVEVEQKAKDGIRKGDSVVIESEGSDMEERSITPDPNQIIEMQEKLMKDKTDLQSEENSEVVEENKDQDLMSVSMHESINLEKGQAIEDLQDESSDDMPVVGRESGAMEGSFILEEGQTVDDLPQGEGSMMGGSFIMEQGQTIEDLEDTGVHEASSGSPDEEIPVQMTRSAMEDSVILDEGQTFDDEAVHDQMTGVHDQMTGSMMAGSMVLGEGETINNQQYQPELEQADESSSTEIHPPSGDIDVMTGSVNVMAGSMFLDESEQLEDTFPQSDTSKSAMEGSMVLDEGETLEDRLPQPETKMSASFSESYSESQAEESSLLEQEESRKEAEEEILPSVQAERVYTEEETKYQQEAAQNMVENVLNDAIDKVESMQRETVKDEVKQEVEEKKIEVEETKHVNKVEEKKTVKTDVEKKEEIIKSKHVTEKRAGRVKTKTEKEKKNESVVIKETKKTEKKVTEVKKERPKSTVTRTNGDDVFSRLYEDSSKRNERARRTPEKPEAETKIPSPTKSDISKRSVSATRYGRRTQRVADDREGEAGEKKESRSKSTPRPYTAPGARASRPTQLHRAKKDISSDSGVEEDKTARQSSASSQKKKYGIDAKNDSYKPGGGRVKIFDQKVQVKASSRIDVGSKTPPGGTKPVNGSPKKESPRPKPSTPKGSSPSVKNVSSRIGSLDNARHTPGGGKVNIVTKKTDYSKVSSRVGSTANMDHRPGGGDKKIQSQKLDWKTGSRIGSLDNASHAPGGGNVKITDEKLNWSVGSRVGSLDNAKHSPGGGNVKIESRKVDFKDKAHSKVGSTDNIGHKPTGGTKKIETQKLEFKDKAKSRVDAKSEHKPGGGDKKV